MKNNVIKSLVLTCCIFIFGIGSAIGVRYVNKTYAADFNASFLQVNYYYLNFDTNGGSGTFSSQKIRSGLKALKPNKTPTRSGYTFLYWSTSQNGSAYNFDTPVTSDLTLYAVWKVNPKKYTVKFNLNGGNSGSISEQTITEGGTVSKPVNPTRNGYTFLYWSTSSSGSEYSFNTKVTSNLTLYAIWEKIQTITPIPDPEPEPTPTPPPAPSITYYTVKFDLNGGTGNISSQSIASGNQASKPSDPSKTNSTFEGWFTSKECNTEYNFNKSVTSNITLYACYRTEYVINFTIQGLPYIDSYTKTLKENSNLQEYNQSKRIIIFDTTTYSMIDEDSCSSTLKKLNSGSTSSELAKKCSDISDVLNCQNNENCNGSKFITLDENDAEEIIYLKNNDIIAVDYEIYSYVGLYSDKDCENKYSYSSSITKSFNIYECYKSVGSSDVSDDDYEPKKKGSGFSITTVLIILAILSVVGFVAFFIRKSKIANSVD